MIAHFRLALLHGVGLLEVSHAQRSAREDPGPIEIAVASGIEGNPGRLQFNGFAELSERGIGKDHLSDGAGGGNFVDVSEAVVQKNVGRHGMVGRGLLKERNLGIEIGCGTFFGMSGYGLAQYGLTELAGIAQTIGIELDCLLKLSDGGRIVFRGERLLPLIKGIVRGARQHGRNKRRGHKQCCQD